MIQSIVHFGEKTIREIMTPRTQIVAIEINSSVEKLLQLITSRSHSRIPVFRDDLDNIEGFIHERDLLAPVAAGRPDDRAHGPWPNLFALSIWFPKRSPSMIC